MAADELRGPALYQALMALKPARMSEYAWAEAAGLNRGFLNDLKLKADASPRAASLNRLLAVAGRTMADLYAPGIEPGRSEGEILPRPFNPSEAPRDVPILGTADGGELEVEDGGRTTRIERTIVEPEAIAHARRPPSIASNRKVYALFIKGESMEPRYRAGDLVYVDPRRDPHVGDDVIVQLVDEAKADADPAEVVSVLVKQLVRKTATHFELGQYNPALTFRIERRRIEAMHRIIPLSELLS